MNNWGDNLITKNILCYSHYDFDKIMKNNGWIDSPPKGVSCISICSPNEYDLSEHWFKVDYNKNTNHNRVFNLDIDDCGPFWFGHLENDCYDKALELYNKGNLKQSNAYFSHNYISGANKEYFEVLHILDYEEAFKLVDWLDWRIKHDDIIYIHCAVGASRSQGVVRYILDTYGHEYDIKTNPDNPCLTPNSHVVMMLKRAYRQLFYNVNENYMDPVKWDEDAIKEYTKDIKLNLI